MTTTVQCSRRLRFCAGHRVRLHESKCRHLHGHNYVVWIEAACAPASEEKERRRSRGGQVELDDLGRVIDFAVLEERVGGWIAEHWDHGFLLWEEDPLKELWLEDGPLAEHRLFLMSKNPTAENIALHLLREVCPKVLAGTGVRVVRVRVEETENCVAEAFEDAGDGPGLGSKPPP